ncbi:glycosyltransferase [Salegentibacter sp. JZCK2]|uniref:glycosyltransferase n=1 Tax=Salegentibacter tibetensis TaxID=2873600 RepID=UPI001CCEADB1|nr:glycosyltransferase [Salegentibacter tibetensis]MBZ9728695.1 glycosyltransferase [Salegentibacter tibetensis]
MQNYQRVNKLAPIVLFTYNRLSETIQTVEALQKNFFAKESELFIFSDGPKTFEEKDKVDALRNYLNTISGFKKVRISESPFNKGLANSIIDGVTEVIEQYGRVIVLEDDLKTSPNFLSFLNEGLKFFENQKNIYAVNGYAPMIEGMDLSNDSFYLHSRAFPWGWATWSDRWDLAFFDKDLIREKIDRDPELIKKFKISNGNDVEKMLLGSLNGSNDSWYIRWIFFNFYKEKKSVFPLLSKVDNIGFNNSGIHCKSISAYKAKIDFSNNISFEFNNPVDIKFNDYRFLKYFSKRYKLQHRVSLLRTGEGAKLILNEVKSKISKNFGL